MSVSLSLESSTYLKHFLDSSRFVRTIFGDVGTEDDVGIAWDVSLFIWFIVSQLLENSLRHISVQVINENPL